MESVIPLRYCIIEHIAVEHAAHAGCTCATNCATSAIHNLLRSKKYLCGGDCVEPQLRVLVVCMCMLLLLLLLVLFVVLLLYVHVTAVIAAVYVHVTAVIAACIVCVCDRNDQTMTSEKLVHTLAKPVPE